MGGEGEGEREIGRECVVVFIKVILFMNLYFRDELKSSVQVLLRFFN